MNLEFVALALDAGILGVVRFRGLQPVRRVSVPLSSGEARADAPALSEGLPVVAHDVAAVRAAIDPASRVMGSPWVDLQALTLAVRPGEPDASLPAQVRGLYREAPNDAVGWAEVTGELLHRLLGEASALPAPAQAVVASLLPDPDWIGPPPVPVPQKQSVAIPGTPTEALAALTVSGLLAHREGQVQYAEAVAKALVGEEICLLEAGPGTGKTIGYLVPLLLALAHGTGRAVVSTRTRALQEQLWHRDLPFLAEHLGVDLVRALLKGRENYLCLRRLEEVRHQLLPRELLVPLVAWAARTETGDLDEIAGLQATPAGQEVLRQLPDLPYRCGGWTCAYWNRCPSRLARERARAARLVVVNHALLGADLASGGTILGPYGYLVVDEAHNLPEAIRDALSATLSPAVIPRVLGELRRGSGGLLAAWGSVSGVDEAVDRWEKAAAAHRRFWAAAGTALDRDIGRYGGSDVASLAPSGAILGAALDGLADAVAEMAGDLPEEDAGQARGLGSEVRRMAGLVSYLLRPEGEESVFWYSRDGRGLSLTASPVEVGEHLGAALWPNLVGGVLTSATLSVGDEGAALARELGIESPRFEAWRSPFSFDEVGAYILRYLPHPDDPGFPMALASTLRHVLARVRRRALALFTSRRLLDATATHLEGIPHLVQRRDGDRERLLARFRHHPPPVVLLGLDTLWEGIDLPGEELELLVVVRLPFPVPTHPLTEARSDRIRGRGGDPFEELFLPRAVLRLRQGVGRLVRTPTDRGAVLLADPRLATRSYGEAFLRALPVSAHWMDDPDQLVVALERLFR